MTTELAETMESVFADIVGTPEPEGKGDAAVIWYLKARQRLLKRRSNLEDTYRAMQSECAAWALLQKESIDGLSEYLDERMLHTVKHVTRKKIEGSGKKSFDYFYGVCGFRNQQVQWDWPKDETKLLQWCKDNGLSVNTKVTINKENIKNYHWNTGEEPPGVTITPGEEKFYVKPAPLTLALPGEQPELPAKD